MAARRPYPSVPPRVIATLLVGVGLLSAIPAAAQPAGAQPAGAQPGVTPNRSNGPLDLRGPSHLVLGQDPSATIELARPDEREIELHVNVGEISAVEPLGEGRWRATYRPPATRFPQVAIIAANTADHELVDWLVLPLFARPRIELASEPSAQVTVRVAEVEFGPVTTDRRGRARVEVVVPPGVQTGVTIARDRLGNRREGVLDLGAPPFGRILAVCPHTDDRLLVFVVDERGQPQPGAPLFLTAAAGSLSPPTLLGPGVYVSRFDAGEELALDETIGVSVELAGDPTPAACRAAVPHALPTAVTVGFDRDHFVAGSGSPITVTVDLAYPTNRRPRAVPIDVAAELGSMGELRKLSDTRYQSSWTLPDRLEGRSRAGVVARIGTEIVPPAKGSIELRPGEMSRLEVSPQHQRVRANGRSSMRLSAHAFDSFDNPVRSPSLRATAQGEVVELPRPPDGGFAATYTAPVSHVARTDTIVVRDAVGPAEARLAVDLMPTPRRYLVHGRLGYLTNLGKVASPLVAAGVAARPPILEQRLLLGLEIGAYHSTSTQLRADGGEEVTVAVTGLPLLARATYEVELGRFTPYGGVTAGLLLATTSIESERTGHREARGPRLSAGALIGVHRTLGRGRAGVELAFGYAASGLAEVSGNIGGAQITLGYAVGL